MGGISSNGISGKQRGKFCSSKGRQWAAAFLPTWTTNCDLEKAFTYMIEKYPNNQKMSAVLHRAIRVHMRKCAL